MDRPISYSGSVPLVEDFLNACRYAMTGLGQLALDTLGPGTSVFGFACTPTAPASLSVNIAPGRIYSVQNVDNNAYSVLPADTAHTTVKQGILADTTPLNTITAPGTFSFSQNWLVQATYQDFDTGNTLLNYFNSANPQQPLSGPGNSGTTQPTVRKGICNVTVKAGTAAATGSQLTPAPDTGNVGLYVITVANGQTAITAGNIALYPSAPFVVPLLTQLQNQRIRLTANTSFFVSPTGNDANNGLTAATPWATVQNAVSTLQQDYDLNGFVATVSLANGTYNQSVTVSGPFTGQTGAGSVVITGSSSANVTVNTASGNCYAAASGAAYTVNNQKLIATTGTCLQVSGSAQIQSGGCNFGTAGVQHVGCSFGSLVVLSGYTVSGSSAFHLLATAGATITIATNAAITLTGTPAFSTAFVSARQGGLISSTNATFTGGASGVRYDARSNGVIDTAGGGTTYFPGGTSGTTQTGGEYV